MHILGILEGVSLMVKLLAPGGNKTFGPYPSQSCDLTTLHLNGSLSARVHICLFAFTDPIPVLSPNCLCRLSSSGSDVPPALSCGVFVSLISTT